MVILIIKEASEFGLGIDWGSEFHKSTIFLPKQGFKMVENSISKRKTPSMMSFCDGERFFESQSVTKFSRANCQTFSMLNSFFELESLSIESKFLTKNDFLYTDPLHRFDNFGVIFPTSSLLVRNFTRNTLSEFLNGDKNESFEHFVRLEEIFAMMLDTERDNVIKSGPLEFGEAVFTIWDNGLSIPARKKFISAATLGGLSPIALVNENTAAAVYFSLDRKSYNIGESENVLFVNIGSSGTKLSLIKFHSENSVLANNATIILSAVTVIKDAFSGKFSGDLLDNCLGNYALDKQLKEIKTAMTKQEFTESKKRRLYNEIKRAKEMLTVNKEVGFYVEDFFDNRHLNVKLLRSEFEEYCLPHFESLKKEIQEFISGDHFSLVELIGGSIRVPKVQDIIKEVTNMSGATHINGDEGMAYGASHIAANFSSSIIKSKRIIVNDGPNYEIDLQIKFSDNTNQKDRSAVLFPFKTNYGTKKKLNIKGLEEDVKISLSQKSSNYFVEFAIIGVSNALEKFKEKLVEEWKVDFHFELDFTGVPKLLGAELLLKEKIPQPLKSNTTEDSVSSNPKIVIHTINLSISKTNESYTSLMENNIAFEESKRFLKSLKQKEVEQKRRSAIKNSLESFVYKLSSDAEDPHVNRFLSQIEIEEFKQKSREIDDFIFSPESESIDISSLDELIKNIENLLLPLSYRREQFEQRENNFSVWNDVYKNMTIILETISREVDAIPDEKLAEAFNRIRYSNALITDLYAEQQKTALNKNPVFNISVLSEKISSLSTMVEKLIKSKRPRPAEKSNEELASFLEITINKMSFNTSSEQFEFNDKNEILQKMKDMGINPDEFERSSLSGNTMESLSIHAEPVISPKISEIANGDSNDVGNLDSQNDKGHTESTKENQKVNEL